MHAGCVTRRGKFLVVFQRPTADTKGEKNMSVIDIASGATVLHLYQKSFTKETWCVSVHAIASVRRPPRIRDAHAWRGGAGAPTGAFRLSSGRREGRLGSLRTLLEGGDETTCCEAGPFVFTHGGESAAQPPESRWKPQLCDFRHKRSLNRLCTSSHPSRRR